MSLQFIHMTDLHLSHPDNDDQHLYSDTSANLKTMIAQIEAMRPAPAFVIASGDLTNHGDVASYQHLRDQMKGLDVPVVYALGNHDKRAEFKRVFGDLIDDSSVSPDAAFIHQKVFDGLQVITLDSSIPEHVSGGIRDHQFDFLQQALQEFPELPKLIVVHHPPLISKTTLVWESLGQSDTGRLAAMLRGHNIVGLLCGHIHINQVNQWHGIPVIINNGLHATVNITKSSGMQVLAGTGYGLCTLQSSGLSVSFVPLTPERQILTELPEELLRSFK